MIYDAYVTLALPAPLTETAKQLSRSFDPDSGGYLAFERTATDAQGGLYAVYGSPCETSFASKIAYLQANPAALLAAVEADYAERWPDLTPPTLADCEAFCAGIRVSYSYGMLAGLEEMVLTIKVQDGSPV